MLYLAANFFSASRFVVHGNSMEPTFKHGQYFLVSRLAYRLAAPRRGDVVVLRDPWQQGKHDIKRIIGLPREEISIHRALVLINGSPYVEPYLVDQSYSGYSYDLPCSLGEDEYWLMGDNRNNSRDSRAFGPLMGDRIVGKLWLCYWPREAWRIVSH